MHVTVLGAGTMGHGIAQVSAMAGHDVFLRDIDESVLSEGVSAIERNLQGGVERDKLTADEMDAARSRITTTTDLKEAAGDADLIVEAVPERLDLKQQVFADVEAVAPDDAILATNTSSLSVTAIASELSDPHRAVGIHFFNPVHIMALVEVVLAEQTDDATREVAVEFVEGIAKTPIVVTDSPGFASSRLGVAIGVEAMRMYEEGVASAADIDAAMTLGYNHPMGPLELTDLVGLDVRLDILEYLREELGERFRPPQVLKRKVRAGHHGKKSGQGFYRWENGENVGEVER
ncbi:MULTISPECIES: 3-hydroxyacyl-CoA dehydrogenase family protein [unclassified Haladaptatus]|uniref:3-hydroxyacyl-CoA dehydrogenase family protein n=1 Tax=unclassified Haladaptatus TaxID=2622732 RepID=UPI0023E885FF|nr:MULTISPECIES: 3-hydroxyacyl-CoA dehydrogenase family protein [unclassified Haladaptatus]